LVFWQSPLNAGRGRWSRVRFHCPRTPRAAGLCAPPYAGRPAGAGTGARAGPSLHPGPGPARLSCWRLGPARRPAVAWPSLDVGENDPARRAAGVAPATPAAAGPEHPGNAPGTREKPQTRTVTSCRMRVAHSRGECVVLGTWPEYAAAVAQRKRRGCQPIPDPGVLLAQLVLRMNKCG